MRNGVQSGFDTANGYGVVYDGYDGGHYLALAQRHSVIDADGELLLYPGQANRLRILFDERSGFDPSRQLAVSGSYSPRWLTV